MVIAPVLVSGSAALYVFCPHLWVSKQQTFTLVGATLNFEATRERSSSTGLDAAMSIMKLSALSTGEMMS